ncbi:MAG: hypothetical protein GF400_07245 [Candidatus Eisenbacteria bacterium]|nr:hypothetical protein [Candidatus Eisenbacteria bacterium]
MPGSVVLQRALVIWAVLAVVAVINGIIRNAWLEPALGEGRAHVLSTLALCALIFLVALASIAWIGPASLLQAALVGVFWVALTLTFEFLAGHFVFGHPWSRLLADYNLLRGRIWILVPIATYLAPRWAFRLRGM